MFVYEQQHLVYTINPYCQRVRPSGRPEGLTRRQIIEPRKDMRMGKKSHKRSKVWSNVM